MDADSLALISARINASLSSATSASQALSDAANSAKQVQFFEASATSVTANTKGGFDILIQALNAGNSQTLMLNSKFPVPVNSQLLLKLEESVIPAAEKSTNVAVSTAQQNSQHINKLLELSLISYTPASTNNSASPKVSSQMQAVLSEWISSRIPVLLRGNNQDSQALQSNAQKTNTAAKPQSVTANLQAPMSNQTNSSSMSSKIEALYQSPSTQALPKMPSISQALSALIANIQKLPEPAQAPLRNWVESLPQKLAINQGDTLKSQVQNSGQFFENRLTSQLLSLTTAQAQKAFEASIKTTATQQASLTDSLEPQKATNEALAPRKEPLSPSADKPLLNSAIINKEAGSTTKLSSSANLFQLLWGRLKPEQLNSTGSTGSARSALESFTTGEASLSAKQVLTSVKEKLEGLANLGFKQATPNWASTLQQGDLKLALAQSLIKTLQFNAQQGFISGQDAQQAMAGRIPININPASLLNETQQLLQQTLAQLEVDQHQQINDDRPTHNAQLYFRDNQQLQQVQIELLEKEGEEQEENGKKKVRQWRIRLHFELEKLGELGVEINLSPPRAAASFWSTQSHTLKALQSAIAPLRARLQHQGVDVSDLQVRHGHLPEKTQNSIQQQLIDIHT